MSNDNYDDDTKNDSNRITNEEVKMDPNIKPGVKMINIIWPLLFGSAILFDNTFPGGSDLLSFLRQFHSITLSIFIASFVNIYTLIYGAIKYGQGYEKMGEFLISVSSIPLVIVSILFIVFL